MIHAVLYSLGGGLCGALLVLACQGWQARYRQSDTPIYIWSIPGQSPHDQEVECAELAASMYALKDHDRTRFAAMWDSGLGREFPTLGRN